MSEAELDHGDNTRTAPILDAVVESFLSGGYDAVNLRSVAREARVSLATIYSLFPSREALCVAGMQWWMRRNFYGALPQPDPDATAAERVIAALRHLLRPYLEQPAMLTVFARVRLGPGGEDLEIEGDLATRNVYRALDLDREEALDRDLQLVIYHVLYSLVAHHAAGKVDIGDIVPILETTVRRLLNEPEVPGPGTPMRTTAGRT